MQCPFCKEDMMVGSIKQDRYALKWIPKGAKPFTKGIKLTSMLTNIAVKVFYCEKCRKFIIDQDDLE